MGIKEMVDADSIDVKLALIDLDGTVVDEKINNTFDFLREYLRYRYGVIGVARYKLAMILTSLSSKVIRNEVFLRKLFITLCTFGLNIKDLAKYAIKCWLPYILNNLNIEVLNFLRSLKQEGYTLIMLTSCIEVPAMLISNRLGFKKCIATRLRLFGPLIVGISEDTYGPLKFESARRLLGCKHVQQAIYVADSASLAIEKASLYVNKVYCVNKKHSYDRTIFLQL
ncbi:MAG: HAD family hydrolase [Desulfurococcaceae archaeon]